jgi:hypothetical protein
MGAPRGARGSISSGLPRALLPCLSMPRGPSPGPTLARLSPRPRGPTLLARRDALYPGPARRTYLAARCWPGAMLCLTARPPGRAVRAAARKADPSIAAPALCHKGGAEPPDAASPGPPYPKSPRGRGGRAGCPAPHAREGPRSSCAGPATLACAGTWPRNCLARITVAGRTHGRTAARGLRGAPRAGTRSPFPPSLNVVALPGARALAPVGACAACPQVHGSESLQPRLWDNLLLRQL